MSIKSMFPTMMDRPEDSAIVGGLAYWFWAFLVLPFLMFLFSADIYTKHNWVIWFEIAYHICNFIVTVILFHRYLKESFLNVQIYFKKFVSISLLCSVLLVVLKILTFIFSLMTKIEFVSMAAFGSLVLSEMDLLYFSSDQIYFSPIWGTICLVLFAPVTISCLYYACCFAPVCNNRPWLAYLILALALLIPRLALAFSFWSLSEELIIYFVQLPVHLFICWAFQKSDTIWTPITAITLSNLVICLIMLRQLSII